MATVNKYKHKGKRRTTYSATEARTLTAKYTSKGSAGRRWEQRYEESIKITKKKGTTK